MFAALTVIMFDVVFKSCSYNYFNLFVYQRDQVESFVSKVNGAMRVRHELEKLKATAGRIQNNYNVVEAVNEEMDKVGVIAIPVPSHCNPH